MSAVNEYIRMLHEHLDRIMQTQKPNIERAASLVKDSIKLGGRFYVFGSGHSHIVAEDIYNRAGGLALVKAILEPSLMLHEEPNKSTYLERLDGYGEVLLKIKQVTEKDAIMIVSNSGRNAVVVEMAIKAKERGLSVIAMTSMAHSTQVASRHESGKKLYEVADVVIDNGAAFGDAAFLIDGFDTPVGPTSSFTGTALAQTLMVAVVEALVDEGVTPPVFRSSNADGADNYNDKLFDTYAN